MAETGAVFDVAAGRTGPDPGGRHLAQPGTPRSPAGREPLVRLRHHRHRAAVIGKVFAEAGRRDPELQPDWIALVDGNTYQLELFQDAAAARGKAITVLIDFIHVMAYLWKVAWPSPAPRHPATETG